MTDVESDAATVKDDVVRSFVQSSEQSFERSADHLTLPLLSLIGLTGALAALLWLWFGEMKGTPASAPTLGFAYVLVLLGVFLVLKAGWKTLAALARGNPRYYATFVPTGAADVAGQGLRGEVRLSWKLRPDESALLWLNCTELVDGAKSKWWYWEKVVDADDCPSGSRTHVPVAFTVPADTPPSGVYTVGRFEQYRTVEWGLQVQIQPNGPAFLAFVIPMTNGVTVPPRLVEELALDPLAGPTPSRPAASRVVVRADGRGGVVYRFPLGFSVPLWAMWTVLTAPLWVALPWIWLRDPDGTGGELVGAVLLVAAVNGLSLLTVRLVRRLRVGPAGVVLERLFWPATRLPLRSVTNAMIQSVRDLPREVKLERESGRRLMVWTAQSTAEARWLASDIDRALAAAKATPVLNRRT